MMSEFIKLTKIYRPHSNIKIMAKERHDPLYIKPELIATVTVETYEGRPNTTMVRSYHSYGFLGTKNFELGRMYAVKESPEEVMALIEQTNTTKGVM